MNLDNYLTHWNAVKPLMQAKMDLVVTMLRADLAGKSDITISEPEVNENSDEFHVWSILSIDGKFILELAFTLLDGDEQGEEGLAISLEAEGVNALTLGGYKPHAYTEDAFTLDTEDLIARVEDLEVDQFVFEIINSVLTNPNLIDEANQEGIKTPFIY